MIRLGHIEYSNCFPVHAQLVIGGKPDNLEIVTGTPSYLNHALETGAIDVAPSSSIEYARHSNEYRLLPGFVIGSDGAVGSILFEARVPLADLRGARVAVPTASATSVVLLKILLRLKHRLDVEYTWFSQEHGEFPDGAAAALWIGDVALRRVMPETHQVLDLGADWKQWTGLPFVFAAWQTSAGPLRDNELRHLVGQLHASRAYFNANAKQLAANMAEHFGIGADRLLEYWQSLRYSFDAPMQQGLLKYYELAAQLGEAPAVERLQWL